jgi:glycyl-tRNA synthetase beta chain
LEEVPARMIAGAQAELEKRVCELLLRERLLTVVKVVSRLTDVPIDDVLTGYVTSFSSPRRLAVLVRGVLSRQQDVEETLTGPSVKVAFKDGKPTAAAEAFAKKAGVATADLKTITNAKGEYLAATVKRAGRAAAEVLAAELPKEIAGIYWAKNMYWRAGKPERFVRPVKWLLALLDKHVVSIEYAGITASNWTLGHRILHGDAPVVIALPGDYESSLGSAHVIADVAARRQKIRKALDAVTRTVPGARWREDEELVETMTHHTEWPSVLLGNFEPEYLPGGSSALPDEVLVTVMRDHQKYFAVEDKDGKLAPHFLAVLNTQADTEGLAIIRHGNERVLRARFNDARFFWDVDQKIPLAARVEMLKSVTFQKDLGNYYDKTERVVEVVKILAAHSPQTEQSESFNAVLAAAQLAKTDLTSDLVKEFTELQGIVGGLYAKAQGHSEKVAAAIYSQYQPLSTEDNIPGTIEGQLLAIADKADTIAGMFSVGMQPTGSKDPFALRRAANGIVKILVEGSLSLNLEKIRKSSSGQFNNGLEEKLQSELIGFFTERIQFYLRDVKGFAYDVVNAVLADGVQDVSDAGVEDVRDAVARAAAVTEVRGSEDFAAISAAFKRMKNILEQAKEKGDVAAKSVDATLFKDEAEKLLAASADKVRTQIDPLIQKKEYVAALKLIVSLRPQVDAFFDAVMVMAPEPTVRANRLALLENLLNNFTRIADFSEIVTAG